MTISELQLALPEIFVLGMTCVVLLADLFISDERRGLTHALAMATLVFAGILSLGSMMAPGDIEEAFAGTFVRDRFGDILKVFSYLIFLGVFVYAKHYLRQFHLFKGEFYTLCLFSLLGMMVLISAGSLLTVYLGLALMLLPSYALVAFNRESVFGSEAALKFFVLSALASGILLFGMSLVFGASGSLDLGVISQALSGGMGDNLLLTFGLVFIVVGIAFEFGAAPLHMWIPDVYHGAPMPITLLLSSVPKLAAVALAIRLLDNGMISLHADWQTMLVVLSAASMLLGNIIAIAQTNIKRMLAYSTIGHMGFVLLGLLPATAEGYAAAMYYAIVYAIMSAGSFAVLILISRDGVEGEMLDDLKGLARRNPWHALMMLMFMFSLAGIPVFVGFFAKWQVIVAAISAGFTWLGILAVISAVIGCFYYLRVVKLMYFDEPEGELQPATAPADFGLTLSINGLSMLGLGIFSGGLIGLCTTAFVF